MNQKNSKQKLFETMARLDKTFKPKLNEDMGNAESSLFKNNPLVANPLKKSGLDRYGSEIDDFNIAEAIAVYVYNYNEDIPTIHGLSSLLIKSQFKPSPLFSYNETDLHDTSKDVYNALVNYYENGNETNNDENSMDEINTLPIQSEAKKYGINPKYTHFAAMRDGSGIINGYDYNGYDQAELSSEKKHYFFNDIADMDVDPKLVAIYTRKKLEKDGINPFDVNNWKAIKSKDLQM
jgi:hypothetical protein